MSDGAAVVGFVPADGDSGREESRSVGCAQCGRPLPGAALVCPNCGGFVYADRLRQLAYEALAREEDNPVLAAMLWRQCLQYLSPQSRQYSAVYARIGALAAGMPAGAAPPYDVIAPPAAAPRQDPWPLAVTKTIGSMLLSILIYGVMFGSFKFAFGFVFLILIHEMGHVAAMWYYRLSASPPVFIPFVGALINLRQNPPNAKVEAIVGIAGPLAGTLGALAAFAMYSFLPEFHTPMVKELAAIGFFLNLFNLLPVPPLDGGRITAAVSPWLWPVGLVVLGWMIVRDLLAGSAASIVLILVLFYAIPRIRHTLSQRGRNAAYYRVSRATSWSMGALYIGLGTLLAFMFRHMGGMTLLGFGHR